jgi:capsular polysaccharide biosynthesis protein
MTKRSVILAILAVVLFIAALFSLFFEKKQTESELQSILNGETDEDSGESDTADSQSAAESETDKVV